MFVQIEETPNPNTLRFIPECKVLEEGKAFNFTKKEDALNSPLALSLFEIEEVSGVLLGADFVAVTIKDSENWVINKPKIISYIVDFFASNKKAVNATTDKKENNKEYSEEDQVIVDKIKKLIEEQVRPAVAMDGGDIVFNDYIEGVVYLEMHGACQGCPISGVTLKNGVENLLKYYIPEVKEVVSISE